MKKSIKIILIIAIILMLIPIRLQYKDGGSVEYKSIIYSITKYHKLNENSYKGYDDGWKIKILGITIYDRINTYVKADDNLLSLEEINKIITDYLSKENTDISNIGYSYIDNNKIVIGLLDNSVDKQNEFINEIFDEDMIKYINENKIIEFVESKEIFDGKIIDAKENYIIVEVLEDSKSFKKLDNVRMNINRPKTGINDFYVQGNNVRITFNGVVEESNPAQIYAVKIELIS